MTIIEKLIWGNRLPQAFKLHTTNFPFDENAVIVSTEHDIWINPKHKRKVNELLDQFALQEVKKIINKMEVK